MPGKTDQELIEILKTGINKEYAFNLIMERYREKLYQHIRRILISHEDTDDALQNTFIKAWFALDKFREESTLYTWLYKISTNEALTILRKKRKYSIFSMTGIEKELEGKLESDEYFNGDSIQLQLQKAILSLPEKQRIVFNMKYFDEMKYEDMAVILNTSTGALKASYHHAVKKINKMIDPD
jgi:RNA polymerase sigma factor (sigma-70 family)